MTRRGRASLSEDRVTLGERLVAALLTPIFFNVAVVIGVAVMSQKTFYTWPGLTRTYLALGKGAWLCVAVPAAVGFLAGSEGTARIFGHAFLTHREGEKNLWITALVWGVFFAVVALVNGRVPGA